MRKLWVLVLVSFMALMMVACGTTKSSYIINANTPPMQASGGFKSGIVEDLSGFQFQPGDADAFSLKEAMFAALNSELTNQGLGGSGTGRYTIDVKILSYAPGSAFIRWLSPGNGATTLSVEAFIVDQNRLQIAKIPVERAISSGGGFTIGAYKYVFEEVAKEIVAVIKAQQS